MKTAEEIWQAINSFSSKAPAAEEWTLVFESREENVIAWKTSEELTPLWEVMEAARLMHSPTAISPWKYMAVFEVDASLSFMNDGNTIPLNIHKIEDGLRVEAQNKADVARVARAEREAAPLGGIF